MTSKNTSLVKNDENVLVSGHEMVNTHQINRNIKKLLENDEKLNELFRRINGSVVVNEYVDNKEYNAEELVWFYDEKIEKLKLLRCIFLKNTNRPVFKDGSYEQSGWKDENEHEDVSSYGIDLMIERLVNNNIVIHENDEKLHKCGILDNYRDSVDMLLMKNDLSNRNKNRKSMFFPFKNVQLPSDNAILNGFYRKYDNGLIEYDIVFRLGYCGKDIVNGIEYDHIECNNMTADVDSDEFKKNGSRYFYSNEDSDIFSYKNPLANNYSMKDGIVERNRNDYVNVYGCTLNFPVEFANTDYMVFCNDMVSYDPNTTKSTLVAGSNSLTFMNKTTKQIQPMLIVFNKGNFEKIGYNSKNGCLVANRFHCKIIGTALQSFG